MSMLNAVKKSNKYLLSAFFVYLIALVFFSLRNEVLYWSSLSLYEFIIKSANLVPFATIATYIQSFFTQSSFAHHRLFVVRFFGVCIGKREKKAFAHALSQRSTLLYFGSAASASASWQL